MKKFTKLFLACAAVTAVTAAMAATAMAVDVTGDVTGSYENGTVTLNAVPDGATTVLVLAPGADRKAVKDTDILYISQDDITETSIKLLGAPTEEAATDALILFGCYDENDEFSIKIAKIGESEGEEVLVGDVDDDKDITSGDAADILTYVVAPAEKKPTLFTETQKLAAGYCDGDSEITSGDASEVLTYVVNKDIAGYEHDYVGKTLTLSAE